MSTKYVHTRIVKHLTAYAVKCVNCLKFLARFFIPPSLKLTHPLPSNKDFVILISAENLYSPCGLKTNAPYLLSRELILPTKL